LVAASIISRSVKKFGAPAIPRKTLLWSAGHETQFIVSETVSK
jgi:hypothetical protein